MTVEELLRAAAPTFRAPQVYIAEAIGRFLAGDKPVMCVNAETGIGKTLAYGVPAALAASAGKRILVSTHTTQQLDQVTAVMCRVAEVLPRPVVVARRLGRANFLSPGRIARVLANRDDLDCTDRALLKEAMAHAGLIDEFEVDNGSLPVPRVDVCLTSSCKHQSNYDAQRKTTEGADLVVQTHAMSVLDVVRGTVSADIVIYDEGDALPSAAAGFAEARVTSLDLMTIRERYAPDGLGDALAAFEAWAARTVGNGGAVFKKDHPEAVLHARAIRAALEGLDAEHARHLRRALSVFVNLGPASRYRGAAVVAAYGGHGFAVIALEPGRVLRRTYEDRKTVFVSATLAVGHADGPSAFEPFLRTVGANGCAFFPLRAEPESFGSMAFVLADRCVPTPFCEDGERDSAYYDYAEQLVRRAMAEGGRTLVLSPSFTDVEELAQRIRGILAHRRGESLTRHLDAFRARPNSVLVTPAAWAGTDLPGLLSHIVILRVPFPPPDAGRTQLLNRLLESRGHDGANAKGIILGRDRRQAIRRLAQGFGRGIRGPNDRVRIWIADPRFPLPDTLVLNPRLLIGQGHAARHRDLSGSIPRRFAATYADAEILPRDAGPSPRQ